MGPQKSRNLRNMFHETLWNAREAIQRRDVIAASELIRQLVFLREKAGVQFLDEEILDGFDSDISRLQAQIGGAG